MATTTEDPKPWWKVYQGDEECRLFKALSRSDHLFRTTKGLADATNLSVKRVEEFIKKYLPLGLIIQHSEDANKWQYWEKAKKKDTKGSISDEDKKRRIAQAASP